MPWRRSAATLSGLSVIRRTCLATKLAEHLGGGAVVAFIGVEAEHLVGVEGVVAAVLELVVAQFVDQTDAAAFLREVEKYP